MTTNNGSEAATTGSNLTAALRQVERALESIDYGSVLITIHQGQVVALETSIKQRLDKK
jgi:hypothetical protein